jgi:hypothetical protein
MRIRIQRFNKSPVQYGTFSKTRQTKITEYFNSGAKFLKNLDLDPPHRMNADSELQARFLIIVDNDLNMDYYCLAAASGNK